MRKGVAKEWAILTARLKGSARISSIPEKDFLVGKTKFAKSGVEKGLDFRGNGKRWLQGVLLEIMFKPQANPRTAEETLGVCRYV